MNVRNTLALLGVLAVIGAYVWFFERGPAGTVGETGDVLVEPTAGPAVLQFDPAEARSLLLARPATEQITGLRYDEDTSGWYVVGESAQPAEESSVALLVSYLSDLSAQRVLTGTLDSLAGYGLDPAEMVVTVGLRSGQEVVVEIGAETVSGATHYARVPGADLVYTISSYVGDRVSSFIDTPPYRPTPTPVATSSPAEADAATPTP